MGGRDTLALVAAVLLLTAGCVEVTTVGDGADSATMAFYVSDRPGALADFSHLNVTVTGVAFRRADGERIVRDVDDVTVDLTRLDGANATLVDEFDVPAGGYTAAFLRVGRVDGTLTAIGDGTPTDAGDVRLPAGTLTLTANATVGADERVRFVYDVTVVRAGGSGAYALRPVASESGTDVEIREVDARVDRSGRPTDAVPTDAVPTDVPVETDVAIPTDVPVVTETDAPEEPETDTADEEAPPDGLDADFVEEPAAGGAATVVVTDGGDPVAGAMVRVATKGERSASLRQLTTDADGTATFEIPADARRLSVEVEYDDESVTLTRTF